MNLFLYLSVSTALFPSLSVFTALSVSSSYNTIQQAGTRRRKTPSVQKQERKRRCRRDTLFPIPAGGEKKRHERLSEEKRKKEKMFNLRKKKRFGRGHPVNGGSSEESGATPEVVLSVIIRLQKKTLLYVFFSRETAGFTIGEEFLLQKKKEPAEKENFPSTDENIQGGASSSNAAHCWSVLKKLRKRWFHVKTTSTVCVPVKKESSLSSERPRV